MEKVAVRLASRSYADEALAQNLLVAVPGIYNVYLEGERLVVEIDPSRISRGEAVRRILDLGYEAVLTHYVYAVRRRGDPWAVKGKVESSQAPFLVAATYDVDEGYLYVAVAPGTKDEEVEGWLKGLGIEAALVNKLQRPLRLSFG